jgi:hypothetical protein
MKVFYCANKKEVLPSSITLKSHVQTWLTYINHITGNYNLLDVDILKFSVLSVDRHLQAEQLAVTILPQFHLDSVPPVACCQKQAHVKQIGCTGGLLASRKTQKWLRR